MRTLCGPQDKPDAEPSCYLARSQTCLFQAGPCGLANRMADSEPTGAARPPQPQLLGCLLDDLQHLHNSPAGTRWLTILLVCLSFRFHESIDTNFDWIFVGRLLHKTSARKQVLYEAHRLLAVAFLLPCSLALPDLSL